MAVDILELAEFYAGLDGTRARAQIVQKIDALWPDPQAEPVLGFGYVLPYANVLWPDAVWHLCMPAQQGVLVEDRAAGVRSALVDEGLMPLRDGALGRAIIIHGLEAANHSNALLSEIWRILVPNGRAIFVVPNRTGMWARRDATPFGAGRPFSRRQLRRQLKAAGFSIASIRPALMLPPALPKFLVQLLAPAERLLALLLPQIGGVWVVDIVKQVPAPIRAKRRQNVGLGVPVRPAFSRGLLSRKKRRARGLAGEFENHQLGHQVLPR